MSAYQTQVLNQIKKTWPHHPKRTLGQLLQAANNIALGEVRTNPAYARDAHIITGLKALIPEGATA